MNASQLAQYFDHTLLRADATPADFAAFCADCRRYGFAMAAINSAPVRRVKELLRGSPVHVGAPEEIGITDLAKPDFGDAVRIEPGEVPVFWACGVTPQSIVMNSKPPFAITHAPGYMLITDTKNVDLKG